MREAQGVQKVLEENPFDAFLTLTRKVLSRSGYGEIVELGRIQSWQKSKIGGCELLGMTTIGESPVKVIIKLIKDSVRTRMLDELSGVCNREQAGNGILVSTQALGPKLRCIPEKYINQSIRVFDINDLRRLFAKHHLLLTPEGAVDPAYLERLLKHINQRNPKSHARRSRKQSGSTRGRTVQTRH